MNARTLLAGAGWMLLAAAWPAQARGADAARLMIVGLGTKSAPLIGACNALQVTLWNRGRAATREQHRLRITVRHRGTDEVVFETERLLDDVLAAGATRTQALGAIRFPANGEWTVEVTPAGPAAAGEPHESRARAVEATQPCADESPGAAAACDIGYEIVHPTDRLFLLGDAMRWVIRVRNLGERPCAAHDIVLTRRAAAESYGRLTMLARTSIRELEPAQTAVVSLTDERVPDIGVFTYQVSPETAFADANYANDRYRRQIGIMRVSTVGGE